MTAKLCLLFLLVEVLGAIKGAGTTHHAAGCEEGWLSFGYFCYYFGVCESGSSSSGCSYQHSVQDCKSVDAHLSSIWSREERAFVTDVLWQPSLGKERFAWFGLHGTPSNTWAFQDESDVIISNLTSTGGDPDDKEGKCGAFKGTGALAFLPCQDSQGTQQAHGFVCKKALTRVFATSDLLNHTFPDPLDPPATPVARGAQLFERVWPPLMPQFLTSGDYLAQNEADSETGCAFRCFNVHGCKAFQVTCTASDMCKSVTCQFYK